MAKTKDILHQKQKELFNCQNQFNTAVSVVTSTVQKLSRINEQIETKVKEIDEYQSQLEHTKVDLVDTRNKNERIIKNFNALLDIGE